jgi:hypothetical protein
MLKTIAVILAILFGLAVFMWACLRLTTYWDLNPGELILTLAIVISPFVIAWIYSRRRKKPNTPT